MIDIKPGEHLGMIGTTGSGKTVFFRKVFMPHLDRLIVVDTEERQFNDLPIVKGDPMKFMRKIPKDKYFRWRWIPNPSTQPEDMEILAEAAIAYGDNIAIYIDELTDFSSATSMGVWLKSLFRKARKRNINLYWASQRPAGVNKWAFDNSAHKMFFFIKDYDRYNLEKYFHGLGEQLQRIEWKSFQSIYVDPSGAYTLIDKA